jgi:hypothetical protein
MQHYHIFGRTIHYMGLHLRCDATLGSPFGEIDTPVSGYASLSIHSYGQ